MTKPDSAKSYQPTRKWYPKPKEEKPHVSNTFELLEGSPRSVRKQYQILADLIDEVKGKIHGSQSHITDDGIKMLIYFEVPVGERDSLHEQFNISIKELV